MIRLSAGSSSSAVRLAGIALLLLSVAVRVHGSHRVRMLVAGDERGLSTFRAISKISRTGGSEFVERTGDGLRVGQLRAEGELSRADRAAGATPNIQAEDRVAVVRPVFTDRIGPVRGWRVVDVEQRTFVADTQVFRITEPWGPGTSPQAIFEIQRDSTPITEQQLIEMFQTVLDRENNSSATDGLFLSGTSNLRVPDRQPLLFDVLVEAPLPVGQTPDSTAPHPIIPVSAAAEVRDIVIGSDAFGQPVTQRLNVLVFSAAFRGQATIFVQDATGALRAVQSNLGVAAGVLYRTVVRNEALQTGANQVLVGVFDVDDPDVPPALTARGFSAPVTMNNPPLAP